MRFEPFSLVDFLTESNRIEGIDGVQAELVAAAETFLSRPKLVRQDIIDFVKVAQPNAVFRDQPHLNVRVGDHIAPRGGKDVVKELDHLLFNAERFGTTYLTHIAYETLHPFTDGNGRSGRILWLWMMGGIERAPLGFLHHFYYQTLANSRPEDRITIAERVMEDDGA